MQFRWFKTFALMVIALNALGMQCEPEKASSSETKGQGGSDVSKYFSSDPKAEQAEAERLAAEAEEKRKSEANADSENHKISFIEISKPDGQVPAGQNMTLKLISVSEQGSRKTITDDGTWSVVDSTVVESLHRDKPGVIRGLRAGTTTVVAEYEGFRAESVITVSAPEFKLYEITPDSLTLGTSQKFRLYAVYSDGSRIDVSQEAVWTTNKAAIATIDTDKTERGFIKGLAKGEFTLNAAIEGQVIGRPVKVTLTQVTGIEVTAPSTNVSSGTIQNLKAEATFATGARVDITQSVEWEVDDTNIATVDNEVGTKGKFTAGLGGLATVTARIDNVSGEVEINVTQDTFVSFAITPNTARIPKGMKKKFNLIGTRANGSTQNVSENAIWTSDNALIATVSNDGELSGTVEAYEEGVIQLSAQYGQDITVITVNAVGPAVVELEVRADSTSVVCGATSPVFYKAFGKLSDDSEIEVTQDAVWSVLNTAIATVSNAPGTEGKITTVMEGSTMVQAVYEVPDTGETLESIRALTVNVPTLTGYNIEFPQASIPMGSQIQATAKGVYSCTRPGIYILTTSVTWSSSNTSVATVSNVNGSKGLITSAGSISTNTSITITATKDGISGSATLTVRPKEVTSITLQLMSGNVLAGGTVDTLVSISFTDGTSALYDPVTFPSYSLSYVQKNASYAVLSFDMSTRRITGIQEGWTQIEATLTTNLGAVLTSTNNVNVNSPCSTGSLVQNLCWNLADLNESCQDFCPRMGGTYHSRTEHAGSEHPWDDANGRLLCGAALAPLSGGGTLASTTWNAPDGQGVGCGILSVEGVTANRVYQNVTTTAAAKHSTIRRACACRIP